MSAGGTSDCDDRGEDTCSPGWDDDVDETSGEFVTADALREGMEGTTGDEVTGAGGVALTTVLGVATDFPDPALFFTANILELRFIFLLLFVQFNTLF